jgi:murein DD-endopeptidase MepM/ murein hydrolase activator NlpD
MVLVLLMLCVGPRDGMLAEDPIHAGGQPVRAQAPLRRFWRRACLLTAAFLTGALLAVPGPAAAAPKPPNPSDKQLAAAQARRQADAAALGSLVARIALLDSQLTAAAANVDAKIAQYDATNTALRQAVTELAAANTALGQAAVTTREAGKKLRQYVRDQYMSGSRSTTAILLTSRDANSLIQTMQLYPFIAAGRVRQLSQTVRDTVAVSNAEAVQRGAVQTADRLQKQAAADKTAALNELATFRTKKAELAAQRVALSKQAAAAYGRLRGLLNQRAAYNRWVAEEQRRRAAAERARQERLRRDELARQAAQQQPQPGPAPPPVSVPTDGTWVSPLPAGSYYISTCFCIRWGEFHAGDDLAAGYGTPIHSVGAGTVAASGPAQGFGNWVVIDHGYGAFSVYGHMRVLAVSAGQSVSAGQTIAYVGSEGFSTGPHLHLEIRIGGVSGSPVDPQVWLARRGVNL